MYIYIYICLDSSKDSDSLRHTGALVMRFEPSDQRVSRPEPSSAEAFGYIWVVLENWASSSFGGPK